MKAHEIEYEIHGETMQFVDIILDPGEAVTAEPGNMMYMRDGIDMETRFGTTEEKGFMGKLLSAGKRMITGESLFLTLFTHKGTGKSRVAFAAPYPGKIVPIDLKQYGTMMCQKDSYLCSAVGVDVSVGFTKKFGAGLFGGEGFILQKLQGDGLAFVHAGGTVMFMDLAPGEVVRVDTGCIVAFQQSVEYDIQMVGGIKSALFGGEGLFFATLRGPGRVFLQSLPFSRLAMRIYAAAPQTNGGGRGEGSVLGGLGGLLDGDNS
ncbi:MAG: TIGR00266 family protein [Candidatus Sumerlaeia bacterium]|nr:TIGR00266 family protein [Candidatus Sumerlaeia bacterium]